MKNKEIALCPICGNPYSDAPALSRTDNKTLICSDCGTRQALQSVGIPLEEQKQIINAIHKFI